VSSRRRNRSPRSDEFAGPAYPFDRHGLGPADIDVAILKEARDRVLTRSIASWLYDLTEEQREAVDGIEFRSRHGDDIRVWAVFERAADGMRSRRILSVSRSVPVRKTTPALVDAFNRLGLHWCAAGSKTTLVPCSSSSDPQGSR
jgi:hypothetical protein